MSDVTFEDLNRAIEEAAPDFADQVIALLAQRDPPEDRPHDDALQDRPHEDALQDRPHDDALQDRPHEDALRDRPHDDALRDRPHDDALRDRPHDDALRDRPHAEVADAGEGGSWPPLPEGTWTLARLKKALSPDRLATKTAIERRSARREAFAGLLAAPYPPPRIRLGPLLASLYARDDEWSRAHLMKIFKEGRLGYGVWQAFKHCYKQAEARHDSAMFGVLAYRLDAYARTPRTKEIGPGTIIYMQRRAWRYLRQLGQAVPEVYPLFAAQVLRHYPAGFAFSGAWVANQIWAHQDLIRERTAYHVGPPKKLERRAFHDAWKISAEPLFRLLEDAENDSVCDFAIRSLKADFPERLRSVDTKWLRRIGRKRSASVDAFLVQALTDSPEFHQSRLRELGLHRTVLDLLKSESEAARLYAVRYAEHHGEDLGNVELIELARDGAPDVAAFAVRRLSDRPASDIGLPGLVTLLGVRDARTMAADKIQKGFAPHDLSREVYLRLALGARNHRAFVAQWYEAQKTQPPVTFLLAVLETPEADSAARRTALSALDERPGAEIGIDWFKRALLDPTLAKPAARWLRAGKLSGDGLDIEWIKGLVMRPSLRGLAIDVLGNRKLVAPSRIGLSWLLAMARQADEEVHRFAQRYLLEHFTPEDFDGIDRVWTLASDKKEPDAIRRFAAAYLKVHHPELGPTTSDAHDLGIQPRLTVGDYGLHRLRPLFEDERADVRNLAAAIGRYELVRWNDPGLLYDLAASRFREPRALAAEVLMAIGDPMADPNRIPPPTWLDAARIFALAERPLRGARDIALNLVMKHYDAIGGPQRLAWLMESPDREVRAFAVRLLWTQHRPRATPTAWSPAKGDGVPRANERFDSDEALQRFLRTVMFGLPPGRGSRQDGALAFLSRPLAASVAKRRLIDVVRDLALEDHGFAMLSTPVLASFAHSVGKGEWQACVTALARIRRAHPSIDVSLTPALTEGR